MQFVTKNKYFIFIQFVWIVDRLIEDVVTKDVNKTRNLEFKIR